MILTVNVGNTHISIGGYQDDQRVFNARLRTNLQCSSDEYAIKLMDLLRLYEVPRSRLNGAIISSVVPALTGVMLVALNKLAHMKVLTLGPGLKSGLNICIENPTQLGGELLGGGVAALALAEPPLLVISADTAITMVGINRKRQLVGGVILPGPQVSMAALVRGTAQLPQVDLHARPKSVLGSNTAACLQAGSVLGTAAMLDGLIARFRAELGDDLTVISTGTLSAAVRESCVTEIHHEPGLILDGLYAIWQRNSR
ncbi:MAG: type III pantothenate kinase [Oscillospiraceae bacterium]|nr:type III pantothenate kinase [Oscillospiraceae bacterium]